MTNMKESSILVCPVRLTDILRRCVKRLVWSVIILFVCYPHSASWSNACQQLPILPVLKGICNLIVMLLCVFFTSNPVNITSCFFKLAMFIATVIFAVFVVVLVYFIVDIDDIVVLHVFKCLLYRCSLACRLCCCRHFHCFIPFWCYHSCFGVRPDPFCQVPCSRTVIVPYCASQSGLQQFQSLLEVLSRHEPGQCHLCSFRDHLTAWHN